MKKHLTKKRLAAYIALLCLLSLIAVPVTYARYAARVNGKAVASAAVWGADSSKIDIDVSNLSPGGTASYEFQVTNTKDGKTSEVGQDYSITVETTGNLPLVFAISSDGDHGSGSFISTPVPAEGGGLAFTEGKSTAEGGFLPHSVETVHTYTLTVTWPSGGKIESDYADEIDLVTVTVEAVQTRPTSRE